LISCKECGKEISPRADRCPNCGDITKYGKKLDRKAKINKAGNTQGIGCLLILLAGALGLTVVGLPFAFAIGAIGVIILIIGLIPVF